MNSNTNHYRLLLVMLLFGGPLLVNRCAAVPCPEQRKPGTVIVADETGSLALVNRSDADTATILANADCSDNSNWAAIVSTLPDAPSTAGTEQGRPSTATTHNFRRDSAAAPAARAGAMPFDLRVGNWSYWAATGAMFSSSFVAAKTTQQCLNSGACTFVPTAFRSPAAMYGAGLTAAVGVSYVSYYLKSKHYRWWFVPEALVTVGNIVVAKHAAHYSR